MKKPTLVLLITTLSVITIIFGTIALIGQQSLRANANDPQIQLASDEAASLNVGGSPSAIGDKVDIATSLAPFVNIYDKSGQVVNGNGYLNNRIPTVPIGVLEQANGREYHSVTWQPQSGVRIAAVSVSADGYYIVSGRSLKEVEKREQHLMYMVILGWLITIVVAKLGILWYAKVRDTKKIWKLFK